MIDPNTSKIRKMLDDMQGSGFLTAVDSLVHAGHKLTQRGTVSLATVATVNDTITAVVMANAHLSFTFKTDTTDEVSNRVRGRIVNTTTITFDHGNNVGTQDIAWEVIEWK